MALSHPRQLVTTDNQGIATRTVGLLGGAGIPYTMDKFQGRSGTAKTLWSIYVSSKDYAGADKVFKSGLRGKAANPKTSLKSNRLTPVAFTIKGKRHTGKAKLVGTKVKIFVTPNTARKINPSLSAGGRPHVVSPDGTVKYVKNLGWILRQWKNIDRLTWENQGGSGVFRADMRDGSVYTTSYASFDVFLNFIDRPVMRGLTIYVNGRKYTVGSPEFKALKRH